jgi:hypothetical protein
MYFALILDALEEESNLKTKAEKDASSAKAALAEFQRKYDADVTDRVEELEAAKRKAEGRLNEVRDTRLCLSPCNFIIFSRYCTGPSGG